MISYLPQKERNLVDEILGKTMSGILAFLMMKHQANRAS